MMKSLKYFVVLLMAMVAFSCSKDNNDTAPEEPVIPPLPAISFAKGADISWVTEMEAAGRKFYNKAGVETDCFSLMQSLGMNTIRLRVWVNPAGGWNDTRDVVAKAVRAKAAGMRILVNFHYSDSWADPGKQNKPAAWASMSVEGLKRAVGEHTTQVLTAIKNAGVTPDYVQIGNETNDGMLWPQGKASATGGMANYAQFVNAGYTASKTVFPQIRVMVHLSNGNDNSLYQWNIGGLISNGARFDVIAMSLYPTAANWSVRNQELLSNLNDMISRYQKEVMVVEVGMPWDQAAACKLFLSDLIQKVRAVPAGKGLGVLYWEPQSYGNWQGYTLGAFNNSGQPTEAMDAFAL